MFEKNNNPYQVRILVIEDDIELAFSLREVLIEEGFEVDVANNGKEGIRLQSAEPYNLIITDIIMPEEDGLEVIMWVRKTFPETKLIAVSGGGYFDSRDYLLMAKELGASLVLCKPFEINSLLAGIKRLLNINEML
jgi:DNA-binding response OmpR family regulator